MAAAGHAAEAALEEAIEKYKGNYILAVEGNPPLNEDGMFCITGGKPFVEQLRMRPKGAKAIISWGACASYGCVQAAAPNPTQATPVHKVITDKPIIKVPGCPPIAEVMTGVITYMLTFDRLPELDRQGRPAMFYGQRIHDKCYRRPHFDAGQFVEAWDDENARKGYCLYKMGCKGPTTYNACSTVRWNEGVSFPIQSGHGCIGCSEDGFWDQGSFYDRLTNIKQFGVEANADQIGMAAATVVGGAMAVHAAISALKRAQKKTQETSGGLRPWGSQTPNGFTLDTAGTRIVVDPVTRIEGHMRCEVNVNANNIITNAVSTGTMWRGLEVILKGRDPARRLGLHRADLRGLHRDPRADIRARGRGCAGDHHPRQRQLHPQHHAAEPADPRPHRPLLPPARAGLGEPVNALRPTRRRRPNCSRRSRPAIRSRRPAISATCRTG
jgi:hydrogenase small subunit